MPLVGTSLTNEISSNLFLIPILVSENVSPESYVTIGKNIEKLYADALANSILKRVSDAALGGKSFSNVTKLESSPDYFQEAFGPEMSKQFSDLEPTSITIQFEAPYSVSNVSLFNAISSITGALAIDSIRKNPNGTMPSDKSVSNKDF